MARETVRYTVDLSDAANRAVSASSPEPAAALSLVGIGRRFGQVVALNDATIRVRTGTVHALLGENGAGKTTLMRVAFGLVQPDSGSIQLNGKSVRFSSPAQALSAGLGMVHQHFTLVPAMTVAENVALGGRGLFSVKEWAERVKAIGKRTGLKLDPFARVSDLSVGAQQRCEIVKALARDVRVLILDEPTAVLAPAEAQELLRWVKQFAEDGHAVVLITHKLRDAMAIASDVTVLRHGATVLSSSVSETSEEALAAAMLGAASSANANANASTENVRHEEAPAARNIVLELTGATVLDARGVLRVNRARVRVHAGEIVGVAAVEGAGQRELLRLLAGRIDATEGQVRLPARTGFVPEDRHNDALLLDRSLVENVALRDAGEREGRMPWSKLARDTQQIIRDREVRAGGIDVEARTLSGGNQQKLVLGRELADNPEALVVENPTRGLDFRAAAAVLDALRRAREGGTAIVVYSSDLDEVLALADRVVVMHEGVLREVSGDRDAIGRAMLGSSLPGATIDSASSSIA